MIYGMRCVVELPIKHEANGLKFVSCKFQVA